MKVVYNPKKKRRNRRRRAKGKNKQIKEVVERVLHSNLENKQSFDAQSGIRVTTSFPTSLTNGIYAVIPPTVSAISGDLSKVGQQIQPRSLRLGLTAFLNTAGGNFNGVMYFDLYVFKIKKLKDSSLFDSVGPGEMNKFFRPSLSGTDTTYEGRCYDWFKNINRDVITILHKKRYKMAPSNLAATSNLNGAWNDNYVQMSINDSIPLSKHLPKTLKYTDTTDDAPNNCAIFATMVMTKSDATTTGESPVFQGGTCTFNSTMVYEDA